MNEKNDYRQSRIDIINQLRNEGYNVYPSTFNTTHAAKEIHTKYHHLAEGETTEDNVSVAGRIMAYRNNGLFMDLQDVSGKIQLFSHKKNLDEKQLSLLKSFDLGDVIGVKGIVRRTPRGEITIDTHHIELLSKAILPLPEKYHGLSDVEKRYRQRYVDLIMNEESRDILRKRFHITTLIRQYLVDQGFMEVETPMLHPIAGGAIAKPFVTHHNTLDMELFLRIAPELYLKKLMVGGLSDKIFEMNRCFRNEGISTRHNPEFTTVEIYQSYVDYHAMMDLTENMVADICQRLYQKDTLMFGDLELNFAAPWQRKSMCELVKEASGIDFMAIQSDEEARAAVAKLGIKLKENQGWGKAVEAVFEEKVEPTLVQPTHVTHFPTEISPLAKVCFDDSRITERFETYVNGWEIANGFSELNDPIDQYNRFTKQSEARDAGDDEAHALDQDFITALEYGMPPVGGLGIGIDRLVMLLTDSHTIREVIAFPTLRPRK